MGPVTKFHKIAIRKPRAVQHISSREGGGQRGAPLLTPLGLQGESDVGVHDRVIVLTAHKLNMKADVEMRGRAEWQKRGGGGGISTGCVTDASYDSATGVHNLHLVEQN